MFKKPVRIKSSNRLKGSERKRLKQNILNQFPRISEDELLTAMPNKEDVFIKKVETQSGEFLTCYCTGRNPLFFEIDKEKILYPSVYMLWQVLDMLPFMVTWPHVFEKIRRGADLMLPGVLTSYGGFDNIKKGDIIGVRLAGSKSTVAVGIAKLSSDEMHETGMKGKGVNIFHWYTDNLWTMGEETEVPIIPDEIPINHLEQLDLATRFDVYFDAAESSGTGIQEDGDANEALNQEKEETARESHCNDQDDRNIEAEHLIEDNEITESIGSSSQGTSLENDDLKENGTRDEEAAIRNESTVTEESSKNTIDDDENGDELKTKALSLTPEEQMNLLLENCFLQAVIDARKAELPMLVTTFSAQFLHPSCPEGKKIDIKKSKYKKMGKFLQEMEKKGLIKVAELSKGVLSITDINLQNKSLREFKSTDFAKEKCAAKELASAANVARSAQEGINVVEMFAVSGNTKTFFKLFDSSKGQAYTSFEVRQILTNYVKDNQLVNQNNKRIVNLDPVLSDVLFDKNFRQDSVPWDVLFTRFQDKMNPCHKVIVNGKESSVKKGKMEPVEVKIEQRMGNKKVTLVKNLEQFAIDPNDFAHKIQLAAASSTTVSALPGKNISGMQVLIQGNQSTYVSKLLEEFAVPKKYINGLDKLKSKTKKR
eukprot:gene8173-9049_t